MKWIRNILNDKKKIRDFRTTSVLLLTLLIPLFVVFFMDSIDIRSILNWNVGSIGIALGFGSLIWYIELSVRAFEDECEENSEIKQTNQYIKDESKVKDVDLGIEFVDTYNDTQQNALNRLKTNTAIKLLERKITIRKIKGKKHKRLDSKLSELKEKGLIDKTYKPIKFNDIISFNDEENDKEMIGINRIKYNPVLDGIKLKILFTILKFTSIGGAIGLSFGLGIPFMTLLFTFTIYIITLIYTTLRRYNTVRVKTSNKYLITRREKLKLIVDMNEYIDNKINKESVENE